MRLTQIVHLLVTKLERDKIMKSQNSKIMETQNNSEFTSRTLKLRKQSIISGIFLGLISSAMLGIVLAYTLIGFFSWSMSTVLILSLLLVCVKSFYEIRHGGTESFGLKISHDIDFMILYGLYLLMSSACIFSWLIFLLFIDRPEKFNLIAIVISLVSFFILKIVLCIKIFRFSMPTKQEQMAIVSFEEYLHEMVFPYQKCDVESVIKNTSKSIYDTLHT